MLPMFFGCFLKFDGQFGLFMFNFHVREECMKNTQSSLSIYLPFKSITHIWTFISHYLDCFTFSGDFFTEWCHIWISALYTNAQDIIHLSFSVMALLFHNKDTTFSINNSGKPRQISNIFSHFIFL